MESPTGSGPAGEGATKQVVLGRTSRRLGRVAAPLVSLGLLAYLVSRVRAPELLGALAEADPVYLVAGVLVGLFFNVVLGADRWRRIFAVLGCSMPLSEAMFVHNAGNAIQFMLPMHSLEMVKALYVSQVKGLELSKTLFGLVYERLLCLQAVCSLALLALLGSGLDLAFPLKAVMGLGLLSSWLLLNRVTCEGIGRLARGTRLGAWMDGVARSWRRIPLRQKVFFLAYAVLYMLADILSGWLLFQAFQVPAGLLEFLPKMVLVLFISVLPLAVCGIGSRELAFLVLFSGLAPDRTLVMVGLTLTFANHLLMVAVGLPFVSPFLARFGGAARGGAWGHLVRGAAHLRARFRGLPEPEAADAPAGGG